MHHNSANTQNRRRLVNAQDGILKHGDAQSFALLGLIDRKPTQDRYRDRIRHVTPQASRRLGQGKPACERRRESGRI